MTQTDLEPAPRLGRKRDHTRDGDIMDAALDVLAEAGYDGMTIEMVATRAKAGKGTLYRRWASKSELVLDAVACMKSPPDVLPDTGSLRGDLVAMIKAPSIREGERKMRVMAGIVSMIARNPELAAAANAALVEPRASINRVFFERAIARGEMPADRNVDLLSTISASMVAYRLLVLRETIDRDYLVSVIDGIVLPAAGVRAS